MSKLAIIAGQGALPAALAQAHPSAVLAEIEGFPADLPRESLQFRIERLVPLMETLEEKGVAQVIFAGAITRPRLDPEAFDPRTAQLVPRLLGAIGQGDDAALRAVIGLFEEFGFTVVGLGDVAPEMVPSAGVLIGEPSAQDQADAARAAQIVAAMGPMDLGQGAVVAQGLCLAVESLPGTDAMLDFVAQHAARLRPDPNGAGGVLYKAPKPNQDRRIDLPAIGPQTVAGAAKAGLSGIVFEAGGAVLIEREATLQAATEAGLFLWARPV